jgi:hypothetical protein
LLDSFARFALHGLGTLAPVMPPSKSGRSQLAGPGGQATSAVVSKARKSEAHCGRNSNAIHFNHEVRRHTPNPGRARVAR